jgi:hypothetical protein
MQTNPMMILAICIILLMILSRIRIVRVPNPKHTDIEKHQNSANNGELIITGYLDILRKSYTDLSDIEILNKSDKDFRNLFETTLEHFGIEKSKLDEILTIQVFYDLSNNNLVVSKAVAKNEIGEQILEYLGKILDKAKKDFA